ncbi:hypothetical protein MPSI1_002342 [Malassezia psittaci]|uniref:Uncharacterized protein n=1 Tax=Malassezia psittaci TaxID=1821823 RepID=A0AAF0JEG1_9BASI|nr:hypothetical protein MPSI1_002342 [Malassezia psittaci]
MSNALSRRGSTGLLANTRPPKFPSDTPSRRILTEPTQFPYTRVVAAKTLQPSSQSFRRYATTTSIAPEVSSQPRIERLIGTRKLPVARDVAEAVLELILDASPNRTKDDIDAAIYQTLDDKHVTPSAMRKLAAHILQRSRSPDRDSVTGRLYALAYRRGDDDAGYSWATMIYEGLIHGEKSPEDRLDEVMTMYAKLARKGHPQALFGMGRLLLEQARLAPSTMSSRFPRIQQLWERAGRNGMPDAWYELGRLFQEKQLGIFDSKQAQHCFEQGARAGSIPCYYALGVLHGTCADELVAQGKTKEAHNVILLSNRYFLQAAQRGHAPSIYNMGLRYLFVNDPQSTLSEAQQREAHAMRWGVAPDDRSAREWFAAASKKSASRWLT